MDETEPYFEHKELIVKRHNNLQQMLHGNDDLTKY
jgi:hypothetical protein